MNALERRADNGASYLSWQEVRAIFAPLVIDGTMPGAPFRHDECRAVIPEAACGYPGLSRKQARIRATITGMPGSIERAMLSAGFANLIHAGQRSPHAFW
jgi:hypothetical protein